MYIYIHCIDIDISIYLCVCVCVCVHKSRHTCPMQMTGLAATVSTAMLGIGSAILGSAPAIQFLCRWQRSTNAGLVLKHGYANSYFIGIHKPI